jgi:hypothetical protein
MRRKSIFQQTCIPILALLIIFSCKKVDTEVKPTEDIVQRFFALPDNADPALKRVIQNLKDLEEKKPFVHNFVKFEGYPIWKNAEINLPHSAYRSEDEGADSTITVPVVRDSARYVNSLLKIRINTDILYRLYRGEDYALNGFDKDPNRRSPNADDIVANIMKFEKEIFNQTYYKITDNRLFDYWPEGVLKPSLFYISSRMVPCEVTITFYESVPMADSDCPPDRDHCFHMVEVETEQWTLQAYCDEGDEGSGYDPGWGSEPPAPQQENGGGTPSSNIPSSQTCDLGWGPITQAETGGEWFDECLDLPLQPHIGDLGDNVVGDFDELQNQVDWANSIDESGLADYPCLKSILTVLKTAPSFYNTMEGFVGVKPTGHIKFGTTSISLANTTPTWPRQLSTIRFNVDYLASSTKSFAVQTFIHELIHANFQRILMRMNDPEPTGIYKDVIKKIGGKLYTALNEHDFMANVFIPYIKSVFQEVDSLLNLGPHYLQGTTTPDPNYYDAISWSGLQEVEPGDGTAAWYALPQATRTIYEGIIYREAQGGPGCN